MRKPIDGRQHLLHLVADDVPAHLERRPIQELAMRLVRGPRADRRKRVGPIDQRRHDHAAAALGQPAGELRLGRDSRRKPGQLLGRLIGIGNGHDVGHGRPDLGTSSSPSLAHAAHDRPADGKGFEDLAAADQRRLRGRFDQLERP